MVKQVWSAWTEHIDRRFGAWGASHASLVPTGLPPWPAPKAEGSCFSLGACACQEPAVSQMTSALRRAFDDFVRAGHDPLPGKGRHHRYLIGGEIVLGLQSEAGEDKWLHVSLLYQRP